MNLLYGILLNGAAITSDYSWYDKHYTAVIPTTRMLAIRDLITQGVGEALPMVACQICGMVLSTQFGTQIKALDNNNTYIDNTRPQDAPHNDSKYCMWNLIKPAADYKKIRSYLDEDIASLVNWESWLDIVAAGCLQMLREAS